MNYTVDPGLYAAGSPDSDSPILVTGNYKMSLDSLRAELSGLSVWILVLDTKGINVWCAAGKGTFGTDEVVRRLELCRLADLVSHRRLILPQLSGPGVAAHEVKRRTGFSVKYGPIMACDLRRFIDSGFKADEAMRRKTFTTMERVILIPVELVDALKAAAKIFPALLVLVGIAGPGSFWSNIWNDGLFALWALLAAMFAGAIVTPILLPWLPGRAFSLKGLIPGLVAGLALILARTHGLSHWPSSAEMAAWMLIIPAATTYLSMNFTGASTYTSLSGVKKEMRLALPLQIAGVVLGAGLWLGSLILG